MVTRKRPHTVSPDRLRDRFKGFTKISKFILLLMMTVSVLRTGVSAESKISSNLILDKSEVGGKVAINDINSMENEKKVRRVKVRGGRKLRHYYPVKDGKQEPNSFTTVSVESKDTTASTSTTTSSTSTSTLSTTTTNNYQLMTMLSTSKPSYVNIIRNTGASIDATQTPLFNIEQEDSSPANRESLEERSEFSRKLPASNDDDVKGDEDKPAVMQSRTSSRLLYPPAIKSTATPGGSTSYMTALTPEFNHVSWLTHPSSTPPPLTLGKMFGLTESNNEVNYQTNFKTFKSSDSKSFNSHSPSKPTRNKNHSFFQLGKKYPSPTSKPPQKQIHITTVTSIKDPVSHFGLKKSKPSPSKKRQFVSIF